MCVCGVCRVVRCATCVSCTDQRRVSCVQLLVQEGDRWPTELTDEELLEACDERGLPTDVTERDQLVAQINQWLAFRRPPPPVSAELTLFAPALVTSDASKAK